MLQNQASRFLRGFSFEQMRLGLLSGRLELHSLALNPEPLDALLLESEIPLVVKAGVLMSAVAQLSLLQGELELVIDGLVLVLGPVCRWLSRAEVFSHRVNEIQRLEFVHMRSQCQRRNLEREMFRQLFGDYLSRLKITVKNVHVRVEIEGEMPSPGVDAVFGMVLNSASITPLKSAVQPQEKGFWAGSEPSKPQVSDNASPQSGELLLAERVNVQGLSFYHEMGSSARIHISHDLYNATWSQPLGVFERVKQETFMRVMIDSQKLHATMPSSQQLMPPAGFSVAIDLRSQPVRDGFHVDGCLTMEITVRLDSGPSRLQLSLHTLEHILWLVRRTNCFQLWQFLHPLTEQPQRVADRWACVRSFIRLRRRVHSNVYSISEAIQMRMHCKEYVRLYKKKFNGPASVVAWRKPMPALTQEDAVRLGDIELLYPADKLVNFRLMAHAELKTEMALNSILNSDDGTMGTDGQNVPGPYRRAARELTPLEQLHLHGQHGYGVNIYRGLPPPPSSLKIRIDMQAPQGLWWLCSLSDTSVVTTSAASGSAGDRRRGQGGQRPGGKQATRHNSTAGAPSSADWAVAIDCTAQPIRMLLVDSVVDASVFATLEVPATASSAQRPLSVLVGRTAAAFANGSPGRGFSDASPSYGGKGLSEWCSVFELDGTIHCCCQLKTVLTSSPNSPWDVFLHMSCGETVDVNAVQQAVGFTGMSFMDGMVAPTTQRGSATDQRNTSACVRLRLPLTMATGQPGPITELLKNIIVAARGPLTNGFQTGAGNSILGWFARRVGITNDIAMFRLHLRMPPTLIEGDVGSSASPIRLPRFDAGVHIEHGGLADGFVVGLHHLRHFIGSLVKASETVAPESQRTVGAGGRRNAHGIAPCPLQPLEKAPPLSFLLCGIFTALAVAVGSRNQAQAPRQQSTAASLPGAVVQELVKSLSLVDVLETGSRVDSQVPSGGANTDPPEATVTLMIVCIAVVIGRRALWDDRDSKINGRQELPSYAPEVKAATAAVSEVHSLFGRVLYAALLMGFPLHSRCLPLAAWAGSLEMLQAIAATVPTPLTQLSSGLLLWAGRGAYANLQARQEQVIRWLLNNGARIDEQDKANRTLLHWACWSGAEDLVQFALRAGLLSLRRQVKDASPLDAKSPTNKRKDEASSGPPAPFSPQQLIAPSPLALAVAGRAPRAAAAILRATGDPHAQGGGCSPLLLALRGCEYELGAEVLRGSPFINMEVALGPAQPNVAQLGGNFPYYQKGDGGEGASCVGPSMRATVALVDSLRRFSGVLSRRTVDDSMPGVQHMNGGVAGYGHGFASGSYTGGVHVASHPPGAHPDEGLFAVGQLPFGDILHPLVVQLPLPVHKVSYESRPHLPPHRWLRRSANNAGTNNAPWAPAYFFVECCLARDFKPDGAVLSRAMTALPNEARRLVQSLFCVTAIPGNAALGTGIVSTGDFLPSPSRALANGSSNKAGPVNYGSPWGDGGDAPSNAPLNRDVEDLTMSFANEIRHLRRNNSGEGVPPLDIAAALGAADGRQQSGILSPRRGGQVDKADRNRHASSDSPSTWIAIASVGTGPMVGPVALDAVYVTGATLFWRYVSEPLNCVMSMLLKDASAWRRYEVSGTVGIDEAHHVVEVMIAPQASATLEQVTKSVYAAQAHQSSGEDNGGANEFAENPDTSQTLLVISFTRREDADNFVTSLQSAWKGREDVTETRNTEAVVRYLSSGPWDPSSLKDALARSSSAPGSARPALRVVIVGAPLSGKTMLSRMVQAGLTTAQKNADQSEAACLQMTTGTWPKTGKARADVTIWDTPAASLPGMVQRLVTDAAAATLVVFLQDASLTSVGAPMTDLIASCVDEAAVAAVAPRRLFVVENLFSGSVVRSPVGVPRHSRHHTIRGNLKSENDSRFLSKAFFDIVKDMVGELESRGAGRGTAPEPLGDYGPWSSFLLARPYVHSRGAAVDPRGDPVLASSCSGDSLLCHPSVVTWAWTAVLAAQVSLLDFWDPVTCGGALVSCEKLDRLLSVANAGVGGNVGPLLIRALADLGLLCPIPAVVPEIVGSSQKTSLGSNSVLVPDFAPRVSLTRAVADGLAQIGIGEANAKAASSKTRGDRGNRPDEFTERGGLPTSLSARLVWELSGGAVPQLRTALRNFIGQGVIGSFGNGNTMRCLDIRGCFRLEAGPNGAKPGAIDSLAPGFLLLFDLVPVGGMQKHTASVNDFPEVMNGSPAKPPTSVQHASPSGAANDALNGHKNSAAACGEDELVRVLKLASSQRLTALLVGATGNSISRGDGGGHASASSPTPFWDVFCSGPHAQWAWRAWIGSGATSPSFTGFQKLGAAGFPDSSAESSSAWPLPRPACAAYSSSPTSARNSSSEILPTSKEFLTFAWLFNGPNAASARSALLPSQQLSPKDQGGLAALCASLCNKKKMPEDDDVAIGLQHDDGVAGLTSLADFEAALLARRFGRVAPLLNEALGGGIEAWALCCASLTRVTHDAAAAVAGVRGRALPLLRVASSGREENGNATRVALVRDGAEPMRLGTTVEPTAVDDCLGSIRLSMGVQAWLRLCKPMALWSAAGCAKGFITASETSMADKSLASNCGEQVVDALQAAFAVQLSEQMVLEVWDALNELDSARTLTRRSGGTWAQAKAGSCGFLL